MKCVFNDARLQSLHPSSTVDCLPSNEGIAIAWGRHRRGPLPLWFTYTSSSLDFYARFAVYFFTSCSCMLKRRFTGTVAVTSSIFCCYSPPSAEANAIPVTKVYVWVKCGCLCAVPHLPPHFICCNIRISTHPHFTPDPN